MKRIALLSALAIVLGLWAWHACDRLGTARRTQAAAVAANDAPAVVAAASLPANSAPEAQRQLGRRLGDAAAAAGLRLALVPVADRLDGLSQMRVDAHGAEDRLRAFLLAAETPPSPIRFTSWSIAADGAGALRLTAEAAAPWRSPKAKDAVQLPDADPAPASPARTLFAIDATPDAHPAADAPPELVGIAGRLPDDAVVLVRLPDGATRELRIGGTANGWRLMAVAADRIRLAKGAQQREIVLPARE